MKRGRPPLDRNDPSVSLHFRITASQYERTIQQAEAARLSHAEWLRQAVARACNKTGDLKGK